MQLLVIRRPNFGKTVQDLEKSASISSRVGNEEMADQMRWFRSYVVQEDDGNLGTVCVYEAIHREAIREHARRVGTPADEVTPVKSTVIVRAEPAQADAA